MANIRPFKALRFNTEKAGDIKSLCCPPYDIVSEKEREELLLKNEYNIIRLELPVGENRYEKTGKLLNEWIDKDILRKDTEEGYYVYREEFSVGGKAYSFIGFMTELEAVPFSEGIVLPHEETLSKAKKDRFELFKATNCNFSQIYALYNDEGEVEKILKEVSDGTPVHSFTDDSGVCHSLWIINDEKTKNRLTEIFADKKLYIADGHHRYETSVNYKNYLYENGSISDKNEGGNFVLTMLVSMESDGLVVFPTHRIVRDLESFSRTEILEKAKDVFEITAITSEKVDESLEKLYNSGEKAFVMYSKEGYDLFVLRDIEFSKKRHPGSSEAYAGLDVNVLHSLLLEDVFGIDKENMANQKNLIYTKLRAEAEEAVNKGTANCAFILNPTKVSEIRDTSLCGEKMPQKSTYFYPKLITGLVMNKFRD